MGTSSGDTSTLHFTLCCPEQQLGRFRDSPYFQGLIFENTSFPRIRIGKGIGPISLSREVANGKTGNDFTTTWETESVSEENVKVSIINLTEALDSKIRDWNQRHPDELDTDKVVIDRAFRLHVVLRVPSEQFNDLLNISWRERYLELTMETTPSIHNVKFPLSEKDKNALKEGECLYLDLEHDDRDLVIRHYDITVKELPSAPIREHGFAPFRPLLHLFRFLFGK